MIGAASKPAPQKTPKLDDYNALGGQAGTGMSLAEFRAWYDDVRKKTGMAPSAWAQQTGLGYGSAIGKNMMLVQPTEGKPQRWGAGANLLTPGSNPLEGLGPKTLSDQGELAVINLVTGQNFQSLRDAHDRLGLGFQFAGLAQNLAPWTDPMSPEGLRALPELQNVGMSGLWDPSSWSLFMGSLMSTPGSAQGNFTNARKLLEDRQALVPDWAPGLQQELRALGVPYLPVEYLRDPDITKVSMVDGKAKLEFPDPSEPLFGPGGRTPLMPGFFGIQAGEAAYLRGLSIPELFRAMAPADWAYYHRPAGAPAPEGFEAGLNFGSPYQLPSGEYRRSPLMGVGAPGTNIGPGVLRAYGVSQNPTLEEVIGKVGGNYYNRWGAYGFPGDPTQNGNYWMTKPGEPQRQPPPVVSLGEPDHQARAEYFRLYKKNPSYNDPEYLRLREKYRKAAMRQNQLATFWQNPTVSQWQNLGPDTLERYQALVQSPIDLYGE